MAKPEYEFFPVTDVDYTVCPGGDPKITERILSRDPDGNVATRILRYEAGADSSPMGVQKHDFWEEVYILEGSFVDLTLDQTFSAGEYACRPPGMPHGPWRTDEGVLTFEVRYRSA
ncbi:cupin [Gordonia sp. JH63]|uniref:cupin domain-containing protein n=1 Tax=Gordonia TaxID=2053 RepID=UPI000990CFEE|nr:MULTISPECIES: cupin domain-containing protein [unclassified Gordonia (in: high G+C Gram-positive bacteria)]MBR7192590.1 cupin domain-containing protein [Gordonia sp. SCSIO 19800]MCX2755028.1 cupin domain-containing protein [Gordonia sp. 4N]MCZ4535240.1 cupin domain-containing protein [Gordonia terrae]QHD84148.1 cupin [Gordonia sp. JH63]